MNLLRPTFLLPVTVLALTACDDDPSGPETQIEIAAVGGYAEPNVTVSTDDDQLFVHIITYGDPCTSRHHDEVDVDSEARVATIHPFNERELGLCFQSLEEIPHEVRIPVPAPGDWLVRVIGQGLPESVDPHNPQQSTVVVERRITVR